LPRDGRWPTFFVIGAMKAGTTSLHSYLSEHPEIHMSPVKEPHFFTRPEDDPHPRRIGEPSDYMRLFASTVRVRGESSPTYTLYPRYKQVPERIAQVIPDAKFIYLVREPVARIVSHYLHNVAVERVQRDFETEIGDIDDPENEYMTPCFYATQLEQYLRVFDRGSILVIDQSDLLDNRDACLRDVFAFLEVDECYSSPRFALERGAARERRRYPRGYERFVDRASRSLLGTLPTGLRRSVRYAVERALWQPVEPPVVSLRFRRKIMDVCADEIDRLRAYTEKTFATWES